MTDITNFQFNTHAIRVVTIDGEPWLVAVDVCRALEMDVTKGAERWLRALDDEQRRVLTRDDNPVLFRGVRTPSFSAVSESGLYKLVLRSDKPQAKPFQDWVTKVVLPAIRKDGAYIAGEEKVASGEMEPDELIARALVAANAKIERPPLPHRLSSGVLGAGRGGPCVG